ncbi:hypothetical protein ACFP1Z_13900 [Streptomyces gamaensis]|uniref:Uncharacterized protein n=1 Tax=Streptomyces gamaensis TaxID=1763542 RepID=A0ABW0Z4C0_9ACTN
MDELSARFTGGDAALSGGVRAAWREDPGVLSGHALTPAEAGTWRDLAEYVERARAAATAGEPAGR